MKFRILQCQNVRVGESINDIFRKVEGRIIFATFASNIHRLQQVVKQLLQMDGKLLYLVEAWKQQFTIGRDLGYIMHQKIHLLNHSKLIDLPANEVTILCTGSQGEPMAAYQELQMAHIVKFKFIPGDTVVFSSSPIPGNTISVKQNN